MESIDEPIDANEWTRLSHAEFLWELQRYYYNSNGFQAFAGGPNQVPSFITSNCWLAHRLMHTLLHMMDDFALICDREEEISDDCTVYVVELGSGTGQLLYLIVQMYREYCQTQKDRRHPPVHFIWSEASVTAPGEWYRHPQWRSLFNQLTQQTDSNELDLHPIFMHALQIDVEEMHRYSSWKDIMPSDCPEPSHVFVLGTYL